MATPRNLALGRACLVLGALALGCVGGAAPRDHFYRLDIPAPSMAGTTLPGVLQVHRLRTDALTRGRAILRRESTADVEVVPYSYHLWIDSPTRLLQREMVGYLRRAGVAEKVATPEHGLKPTWTVSGDLVHLEHLTGAGPSVLVELRLAVYRTAGKEKLLARTYRVEQPTAGADVKAAVVAFATALEGALERFAGDLAQLQ